MARPRRTIDLAEVERLAGLGLTEEQICAALRISPDTLRRRKRESEDVAAAILRGRAGCVAQVAGALLEQALGGNLRAQVFFLKARAGWTEVEQRPYSVGPYYEQVSATEQKQLEMYNRMVRAYLRAHD